MPSRPIRSWLMKSCALVPARAPSKVITTAPSRPVPASSRSFAVSSVSLNCGVCGLKKLRGCGSNVTASAPAEPAACDAGHHARWPRWKPSKLRAPHGPVTIVSAGFVAKTEKCCLVMGSIKYSEEEGNRDPGGAAKSRHRRIRQNHDRADLRLFKKPAVRPAHTTVDAARARFQDVSGLAFEGKNRDAMIVDPFWWWTTTNHDPHIRNLLKQLGFRTSTMQRRSAAQQMRSKKYGLVISDWNMEPMTGYDFLRESAAIEPRHTPLS